jgi:hypothetical protein
VSLLKSWNGALTIWIYYENRKKQYPHTEQTQRKDRIFFLDIATYMGKMADNPANAR